MSEPSPEGLRQAVGLLDQLRSGQLNASELSAIVVKLDKMLQDPNWFEYAIDQVPELSAEEVVRMAYSYRPVNL